MQKIILISAVSLLSGCMAAQPITYTGRNGGNGFNDISLEQATAECRFQADNAINAELNRTGGVFSAAYEGRRTMDGCMSSKGFSRSN
jgi:hypothetical protein